MTFSKSKNAQNSIGIIDVKKGLSLAIIVVVLSVFTLNAQSNQKPPKPPATTSASTSYSIDNYDKKTSSSISISVSDNSYKFRARYHKSKTEGIKSILLKQLGENNLQINGHTYLWSDSQDGDEVFECKLVKGHLRMHLETKMVSKEFFDKINKLGDDLEYYISGIDYKKRMKKFQDDAQHDLERAKRELDRAKRNLERAKREVERTKREAEHN